MNAGRMYPHRNVTPSVLVCCELMQSTTGCRYGDFGPLHNGRPLLSDSLEQLIRNPGHHQALICRLCSSILSYPMDHAACRLWMRQAKIPSTYTPVERKYNGVFKVKSLLFTRNQRPFQAILRRQRGRTRWYIATEDPPYGGCCMPYQQHASVQARPLTHFRTCECASELWLRNSER